MNVLLSLSLSLSFFSDPVDISRFGLSFDLVLVPLLLDLRNNPDGLTTAGALPLPEEVGAASSGLSTMIEGFSLWLQNKKIRFVSKSKRKYFSESMRYLGHLSVLYTYSLDTLFELMPNDEGPLSVSSESDSPLKSLNTFYINTCCFAACTSHLICTYIHSIRLKTKIEWKIWNWIDFAVSKGILLGTCS